MSAVRGVVQCGQGRRGGFFRYGAKKFRFLEFMMCPHGQEGI